MNDLGWRTIPIVTVVAFTLMGIEGIADEIEMPFGEHIPDIVFDFINGPDRQVMTRRIYPLVSVHQGGQAILLNAGRYLLRRPERRGAVSV